MVTVVPPVVSTELGESDVIDGVAVAAPAIVLVAATVSDSEARPIEAAPMARPVRLVNKFRNMFLLVIGEWLRGAVSFGSVRIRSACQSPS